MKHKAQQPIPVQSLCENMAASLGKVSPEIRARWLVHLVHADKAYGDSVCLTLVQQEAT